ncbi:MAG TPA: hypothetical protein VFG91_00960 [Woeseiaceae bacterium]|nr:hypothetical protein [Woeseiaceae bacterium]
MPDSTRVRSIGVVAAAGLVLVLAVPVTGWRLHSPFLGVGFTVDGAGEPARVTRVVAGGTADAVGVEIDDRLLWIGGVRIPSQPDARLLWGALYDVTSRFRAGERVRWLVLRDGELRTLEGVLRAGYRGLWISQLTVFGSFWVLAFFLWWARAEVKAVRLLVYAVLAVTTGQYFRFAEGMPLTTPTAVAIDQVSILARFLGPALVVHFGLVFPTDWRRRHSKAVILGLAYGIPFLLFLVEEARSVRALRDSLVPYPFDTELLQRLNYYDLRFWVFVGSFVACGALLLQTYRHLKDEANRRRVKWVVWGVTLAAGIDALAMTIIYVRFSGYPLSMVESYRNYLYLLAAAGIAISVFRDDLFDVDVLLRRTVVTLATAASIFVVFAAAESACSAALENFVSAGSGLGSIAAGVLAAAAFAPVRRWIDARVRRILPPDNASRSQ